MEAVEQVKQESLYANAVKHGLIIGVIAVVLRIIAYATSLAFMGSLKFLGLVFLIYIGYLIYAGIKYRNSIGGYISYSRAFAHGFIVAVLGGIVGFVFDIVLYDIIDPELGANLSQAILANTEDTMRSLGMPEDAMEETLADMRKDLPEGFTLVGRLEKFATGLIWFAAIVLLTSLVVRKNEPVEM
jgi:hypothetical protein